MNFLLYYCDFYIYYWCLQEEIVVVNLVKYCKVQYEFEDVEECVDSVEIFMFKLCVKSCSFIFVQRIIIVFFKFMVSNVNLLVCLILFFFLNLLLVCLKMEYIYCYLFIIWNLKKIKYLIYKIVKK